MDRSSRIPQIEPQCRIPCNHCYTCNHSYDPAILNQAIDPWTGFHPEVLIWVEGAWQFYELCSSFHCHKYFLGWQRYCMVFSELANMYTREKLRA